MSIAEITNALPRWDNEELQNIERALVSIYRQRRAGTIYNDACGELTKALNP